MPRYIHLRDLRQILLITLVFAAVLAGVVILSVFTAGEKSADVNTAQQSNESSAVGDN
jgi:flagellar basal body-associated protein FliL